MQTAVPPVVLLHGSGLTSRAWSRWALPGRVRHAPELWHSPARGPWTGPRPFRLQHDLDEVLAWLEEHGPADVIGHSYGGALALYAAASRPDLVRAAVAYEPPLTGVLGPVDLAEYPPGFDRPEAMGTDAWFGSFYDWWNGPGAWLELPRAIRAGLLDVGTAVWGSAMDLLLDPRPLASYRELPPTLLLRGGSSPPPLLRAFDAFATLPQVRVRSLDELGHNGPFSRPEVVEPVVLAFLDEVTRGAASRGSGRS